MPFLMVASTFVLRRRQSSQRCYPHRLHTVLIIIIIIIIIIMVEQQRPLQTGSH